MLSEDVIKEYRNSIDEEDRVKLDARHPLSQKKVKRAARNQ